jgi:hypothetical protein
MRLYKKNCAGNKLKSNKIIRMNIFGGIEQGEARHRKYKRLKLGGSQPYDRSND